MNARGSVATKDERAPHGGRAARRYRLRRRLGIGGMAEVFEATVEGAEGFARRVAVKLLQGTSDEARRLFLREARIASQLHHGAIVQVQDYGTLEDGTPFLVMELVEGLDAGRALDAAGPFPPPLALLVVAEAARALHYAHHLERAGTHLGIVHRDVSPSNLLLAWSGDVKIMDFGIATWTAGGDVTEDDIVRGKVRFMAPEQFAGQEVGPAVDVHALGATLHALLTGASPVAGVEAMVQRLTGAGRLEPDGTLAPEVATLIVDAMRLDPAARIDAEAFAARAYRLAEAGGRAPRAADLAAFLAPLRSRGTAPPEGVDGRTLAEVGPRAFRVSTGGAPSRTGGTRRAVLTVLVAVAVAVPVGALVVPRATPDRPARRTPLPTAPPEALAPPAPAPTAEPSPSRDAMPLEERSEPVPEAEPAPRARRRSRPRRPSPPTMPPPATGWIRVGARSPEELGAEVHVDGEPRGFAPLQLELPAGEHRVEVRRGGRPLRVATVDVGAEHTRARALRVP